MTGPGQHDDDARLLKYRHVQLSVLSSTQIASRTSKIISHLEEQPREDGKPTVVSLTARAKAASKLISIAEIVKRDLAARGSRCYQYNALDSELADIPRDGRPKQPKESVGGAEEDEESDEAFETMGAPTGPTKKRSMPVMTIYFSKVPIKELKADYGEQRQ
ncbi:hypothetical protein D0869_12467 [Hortaea werneckii]|uniref:DNA/RNA-binding protein Alba-like domain-containing protein n=1 Tax=Hortaea werneckii TaxID=91943 RepID=A0A3M6YCE4_HORWE|nr:hypothetical protein KC334_g17181 [Hortaea werneckii]KAI6916321.1 hypothetical protein KC355_g17760 [Hortaea werneckii]KAI7112690.1 hypothetical protein KC324_g19516 [Hortaea werneckii]KAI7306660.1 hypothetical protein KC315_g14150 [Hortaea werneckii]KAI7343115.1 hypothetical protein KC354_g15849 [Hortaea werneckii]